MIMGDLEPFFSATLNEKGLNKLQFSTLSSSAKQRQDTESKPIFYTVIWSRS